MKKRTENFLTENNIRILKNSSINKFLTLNIGGKVSLIIFTENNSDLLKILKYLFSNDQNYILIGGGSNIIFPDSATDLIVIVNRTSSIEKQGEDIVKVNSGLKNSVFLDFCKKNSLSGFEFLAGIPGTIGGATAVNAGAYGKSISDLIIGADIFTNEGEFKFVEHDFFKFEYIHAYKQIY